MQKSGDSGLVKHNPHTKWNSKPQPEQKSKKQQQQQKQQDRTQHTQSSTLLYTLTQYDIAIFGLETLLGQKVRTQMHPGQRVKRTSPNCIQYSGDIRI